jgi:hypothetical protein
MLLQTGTRTWIGYDAWEKNKEGGRCQTYTSKEKSESIYFSDTIQKPFYNFRPMVLEKNSKKTQTC